MPRVLVRAASWPSNSIEEPQGTAFAHFGKETSCSYLPCSPSYSSSAAKRISSEVLVASLVIGCIALGLVVSATIFYFVRLSQRHASKEQQQQPINKTLPLKEKALPQRRTLLAESCLCFWLDLTHRCRAWLHQYTPRPAKRVSSIYECKTSLAVRALASTNDLQYEKIKLPTQPEPILVVDTIQPQARTNTTCCGTSSLYSNQIDRFSALTLFEEHLLPSPSSSSIAVPTLENVVVRLQSVK